MSIRKRIFISRIIHVWTLSTLSNNAKVEENEDNGDGEGSLQIQLQRRRKRKIRVKFVVWEINRSCLYFGNYVQVNCGDLWYDLKCY